MTEPPLPALDEGLLDLGGLEALLRDIEACTELLEVRLKGDRRERADDAGSSLDAARAALRAGTSRGVQLRYRYEQTEWWDTVLAVPGGFRVVRMRHDWP